MCRTWVTTAILTALAVWSPRPRKMPQKQATQHGEPTPPFQQNEMAQKERIQNSHLDTLLILQSPLEHPSTTSICCESMIKFGHPAKILYVLSFCPALSKPFCTLSVRHAERLRLQSMPRPPAHYSLIREVRGGVDVLLLNI